MSLMSTGRVDWGSYSGEDLETVMAILLLQERPSAWHRAPSIGDGGVDVAEPVTGGYTIYQIKKFANRLTASQKAQIKSSYETVLSGPRLDQRVVEWNLVMPLDPTSEDDDWFRTLTADAPFESRWLGRVFWDSEASKYPYVIDYFFRDGKERLLSRIQTLHQLLANPDSPPRPGDVVDALGRLRDELNSADPYYTYDFAVTGSPPSPRNVPRLVMSQTRGTVWGGYVTVDIIARYGQATSDRPVRGSLTVVVVDAERGIDVSEEMRAFQAYGRELILPEGALGGVTVDAPGGLGGTFEGGQAAIGPRRVETEQPHRVELDLLKPTGELIVSVTVEVSQMTRGDVGIELTGTESHGAFDFDLRIDKPDDNSKRSSCEWSLRKRSLSGLAIAYVMPAIRFMCAVCAPNRLRVQLMNGPARIARAEADLLESEVLSDEISYHFSESLSSLQPHTSVPIILPDQFTREELDEVEHAARLLRGEIVVVDAAKVELVVGEDQRQLVESIVAAGGPLTSTSPLAVTIAGTNIPLGFAMTAAINPRVEGILENSGQCTLVIAADTFQEIWVATAA